MQPGRSRGPGAAVTFIMARGPKHVRIMSAIVWEERQKRGNVGGHG